MLGLFKDLWDDPEVNERLASRKGTTARYVYRPDMAGDKKATHQT